MKHRSKIDFTQLAKEIREMNPRRKLWHVLSVELDKIGRWRVKERGDPAKGYAAMKQQRNKNNEDIS